MSEKTPQQPSDQEPAESAKESGGAQPNDATPQGDPQSGSQSGTHAEPHGEQQPDPLAETTRLPEQVDPASMAETTRLPEFEAPQGHDSGQTYEPGAYAPPPTGSPYPQQPSGGGQPPYPDFEQQPYVWGEKPNTNPQYQAPNPQYPAAGQYQQQAHYAAPGAPQPYAAAPTSSGPKGLAIAAFVAGIVAFLMGFVPILGTLLALAGIVLGIIALVKRQPKAFSIIGLSLATVALLVSVFMTIFVGSIFTGIATAIQSSTSSSTSPFDDDEFGWPDDDTHGFGDEDDYGTSDDTYGTSEEEQALSQADIYANMMGMSRGAIFKQLTSEYGDDLSEDAAEYAVENVDADWKANALQSAQAYKDSLDYSDDEIREVLMSEADQYTKSETEYAIKNLN